MSVLRLTFADRTGASSLAPVATQVVDEGLAVVRKLTLPVGQTRELEVSLGNYFIQSNLPSGELVTATVSVPQEGSSDVTLEPARPPHEWLGLEALLGEFDLAKPRDPARSLALRDLPGTWARLYVKNRAWSAAAEWDWEMQGREKYLAAYGLRCEGGRLCMLQVGGPKVPRRMIALPPSPSELRVFVGVSDAGREFDAGLKVRVLTADPAVEMLLAYLTAGDAASAEIVTTELAGQLDRELAETGKALDPARVAVVLYALLKTGTADLHDWPAAFVQHADWLPDAHVIEGWHALQGGEQRAQEAGQSLLTAADRGVPMYTQGLRMLLDGLQLLEHAGTGQGIRAALEKARKYGDAADWSCPTTTFLGANPRAPSLQPTKGLPRGRHSTKFIVDRARRRALKRPSEQVSHVGLILAGTGAHGAYEAGVLMELLPQLEAMGHRPRLIVGIGMGAFNAAFLGATAHLPAAEAADQLGRLWQELKPEQVMKGLSISGFRYLGGALGVSRLWGLLDPAPLADTLQHSLDWKALHRNVENGHLDAVAVVATQSSTSKAVVFVDGSPAVADAHRSIDYVRTGLSCEHVLASAAIPLVFPAVQVTTPSAARGWYFDGAVKLKTPIKPALALGATRVVTISMNPSRVDGSAQDGERPDFADGALHLLEAAVTDSLNNDIETLAVVNAYGSDSPEARIRQVPYIFVAPSERRDIGKLAMNVYRERYGGVKALRSPDFALLARLSGRISTTKGELLSYIFFSPEFLRELVKLGQTDAKRWTWSERGSDAPWRLGPRAEFAV